MKKMVMKPLQIFFLIAPVCMLLSSCGTTDKTVLHGTVTKSALKGADLEVRSINPDGTLGPIIATNSPSTM